MTYAGLVRTRPLGNGYTDISGYFRHENLQWYHLATYRRKTDSPYLSGFYSFVENFESILINETRRTNYGNQWVRNVKKDAQEMTVASLTHTSPLVASDRYGAGIDGSSFYIFINGLNNDIPKNTTLVRKATGKKPDFDMKGKSSGSKTSTTSQEKKQSTAHGKPKSTAHGKPKSKDHGKAKSSTHHNRGKKTKSLAKKRHHNVKPSNSHHN